MFYYISGKLAILEPTFAVVDAGGVGYRLTITQTTYAAMPPHRSVQEPPTVTLYSYMAVREDGIELFGFATEDELKSFKLLITVSGVGPKMGISILAAMSAEDFAYAIATADVKGLSKVKGLGKKTAEKIVLELHGKISAAEVLGASGESVGESVQPVARATPQEEEAITALMGLGFTRTESAQAVKKARDNGAKTVEDIIMKALQGGV